MRSKCLFENIDVCCTDGLRRIGANNIERARVRSIQMALVIIAAFFTCWTPYYFMCVWYVHIYIYNVLLRASQFWSLTVSNFRLWVVTESITEIGEG